MLVVNYCDCNYCGKRFDLLDENELSDHLLSSHPEVKGLDIHIEFEQSALEKMIRGTD